MKCIYHEQNLKEGKCPNSYWNHTKSTSIVRCRLFEYKQKKAVCPYDDTIYSPKKSKKQKVLEEIKK